MNTNSLGEEAVLNHQLKISPPPCCSYILSVPAEETSKTKVNTGVAELITLFEVSLGSVLFSFELMKLETKTCAAVFVLVPEKMVGCIEVCSPFWILNCVPTFP